jgi:hypothetical protein
MKGHSWSKRGRRRWSKITTVHHSNKIQDVVFRSGSCSDMYATLSIRGDKQ